METTQLDTQTTAESNVAVRPEEPSLPPLEWMQRNLFGGGQGSIWAVARSSVLTIVFTLLGLFAYQQLLNFIFSEETNWNSVRVNLRLLFTQAYPESDYHRVWISLGLVLVLSGVGLGLMKVGQGISMKKIATWCVGWGGLVVLSLIHI